MGTFYGASENPGDLFSADGAYEQGWKCAPIAGEKGRSIPVVRAGNADWPNAHEARRHNCVSELLCELRTALAISTL